MAVDPHRLAGLREREEAIHADRTPRSRERFARGRRDLLGGVPMPWMVRWPGGYPVVVTEAHGARFRDLDGHEYVDLCLGDTAAMAGHAPGPVVRAIAEQAARGLTFMLPTEDALWCGEELTRRFGLVGWQFTVSATDANRFVLRLAREITGRPKVLVHHWCYHGTVDEAFATIGADGTVGPRPGNLGPPVDPATTTRVVEINDLDALERELAAGDVAAVLVEPALTNIGIVLPDPGYHAALRDLTRAHGTLLVIDETHTICAGPGGFTRAHHLDPDVLVIGKAIAGGVPAGVYGFSAETAARAAAVVPRATADVGGIGGTLAGNALAMAAIRATLGEVLTDAAFARMLALGDRFTAGVQDTIDATGAPWHVTQLGCRAEYLFRPLRARTGGEAHAAGDEELDAFLHLYALNRGILLTPFHNMALMSPATTEADVDRHTAVFAGAARELLGLPA